MFFFMVLVLISIINSLLSNSSIIIALFQSIGFAVTFITIFALPSVVNFIWNKLPCLNRLVAPNLNGTYKVTTTSNYEISKAPSLEHAIDPADLMKLVAGELVITAGLFSIVGYYLPDSKKPSRSESTILSTSLKNDPSSPFFEFHYIYRASVFSPNAETDAQSYMGAAYLEIPRDWDGKTKLTGNYWTNRSWTKGINTAGEMQWEPITSTTPKICKWKS